MDRRSFISGAGMLALTQLVAGCGGQNSAALRVRLLKNSIPVPVLNQFRKSLDRGLVLDFKTEPQLQEIFTQLQTWQQPQPKNSQTSFFSISLPFLNSQEPPSLPDLVSLGDFWLATAIKQKLIEPLDLKNVPNWEKLPQRWRSLVTRNDNGEVDPKGQIWAAPYRWGTTLIAYRRDKLQSLGIKPPQDWADLWQDELKEMISLPNQPREVIGLTLKKLGKSYNTKELAEVKNLKAELEKLHRQVKLYSSGAYLQPLILGDTAVAVGWSTDILPILAQQQKISAVIPKSGTSIWADLWVKPKGAPAEVNLRNSWIDFCWQPSIATQLSLRSKASSPVFAGLNSSEFPKNWQSQPLLFPDAELFKKSEFLLPLPDKTLQDYEKLWREIRLG